MASTLPSEEDLKLSRPPSPPPSPDKLSTCAPSEASEVLEFSTVSGLIVFDWDDTLFPTNTLQTAEAVLGLEGAFRLFEDSLRQHAVAVEQLLRAASKMGRVCILTLAAHGWVENTARLYLPGLDLPQLLEELCVPIYYAREWAEGDVDNCDFDELKNMKMAALVQALGDAYADVEPSSQTLNVVSIGDSNVERLATQELLTTWANRGMLLNKPSSKTIKLVEKPALQTLTFELRSLLPRLQDLHGFEGDLDMEPFDFAQSDCFASVVAQ